MDTKRITLRIPENVYDWITDRAEVNAGTVTGEIISILRTAMNDGFTTPDDVRKIVRDELSRAGISTEKN